ncbi:unnamed protein product, partial [Symbiodinium pilosum]
MGAQDTNSGGMELFFRRRLAEGRAAGEGQLSPPGEAQKISEISAPVFKDVESEAKETKERNKWQCAICGRWEDPSGTSRRKCSSCGGPGFENKRATSSLSSTMALAGRNDGNDPKKRGPHRKKDVGQGQTDRDFMDEEKVVWGVEPGDLGGERKAGSFNAALEIAKNEALLTDAVDLLKKDFWSDPSREAQLSKRKLVMELAQAVGGEWWTPPLNEKVVLGVAAALKAARLRTASALISELKLWHVEQGHSVSDSLNRLLGLAKKSVSRNLGPTERALEVKLSSLEGALWQCSWHMGICEPVLAYAWAVIFILRCAEVAAVRWSHVSVDEVKKHITLKIPISKMDQSGWGVRCEVHEEYDYGVEEQTGTRRLRTLGAEVGSHDVRESRAPVTGGRLSIVPPMVAPNAKDFPSWKAPRTPKPAANELGWDTP